MLSDTPAAKLDAGALLLLELAVSFTVTGQCCMGKPAAPEAGRATAHGLQSHFIPFTTWQTAPVGWVRKAPGSRLNTARCSSLT